MSLSEFSDWASQFAKDMQDIGEENTAFIHTSVEYAYYQEKGSSQNPPNEFMKPAAEKALNEFSPDLFSDDNIQEEMAEVAKKAASIAKEKVPVDTGNLKASIAYGRTLPQAIERSRSQAWRELV